MLANLLNKPGGRVAKHQQDEVLQLIRNNDRSITVVDCGKDVEDEFIVELCQALISNRFVTTLRIRDKEISGAMFPLAELCKKTSTLVSIKISYGNLSDDDVQVLFLSLLKNTSVQSLALDHNRIMSADAVIKLLTFNKTIDSLDLSYNNLGARGDEALNTIADALGANRSLKQLYLSGNGMSDVCARRFVQVLDQNVHVMQLRVLDIAAENSVRPETKQALKLVLDAARQNSATASVPHGRRTVTDADDLRSQLAGLGAPATTPDGDNTMSSDDVKNWQEQVDSANGRFEEERKEFLAVIERLKAEKEQLATGQIAALEQTNKLQQQVAVLTERSMGLQRDLDLLTVKYEKKVRESADQIASLQTQVTAARRELVRCQELSAADRATLVAMQEGLTLELTQVHAQLAAAVKADDLIDSWNHRPPTSRTLVATIGTSTEGLKTAAPQQTTAPAPTKPSYNQTGGASSRPSDDADAWSDDTDVTGPGGRAPTSHGSRPAPTPLPRDQWLDDDATHDCRGCRERFTLTKRRHHCRLCGRVFCGRCAPEHKQWGMRACTFCVATHN